MGLSDAKYKLLTRGANGGDATDLASNGFAAGTFDRRDITLVQVGFRSRARRTGIVSESFCASKEVVGVISVGKVGAGAKLWIV